jgi:sugar/nucleoside kinase (ribokinase family)
MPRALVVGDVIEDILVMPHSAIRADTDTPSTIRVSFGGSGANFACWLASEKVEVELVARVGHSDKARVESDLQAYGVTPSLQFDQELPTGSIVVLVEGQQRSFLTDRGANTTLDTSAIKTFPELLYLSGYSLFGSISETEFAGLIASAKAAGSMVVLDPGSAGFINDFGVGKFLTVTQGVDLVTPSLEEGRILTGEDRPEVIAAALAERYPMVALTLGERGVVIAQGESVQRLDAFAADLVDATGAGDAFAAGLVAKLLAGSSFEDAAKHGVRRGAVAVTLVGGRPPKRL